MCLQHNFFAAVDRFCQINAGIGNVILENFRIFSEISQHLVIRDRFFVIDIFNHKRFVGHNAAQSAFQIVHIQQITGTDAFFHIFIAVDISYAATGRTEFFAGQPFFFQAIQTHMEGKRQHGTVADLQVLRRNFNSALTEFFNFAGQMSQVNHHAVTHHTGNTRTENAGRKKIQHELTPFVDYGVPGVVSALIPHHNILSVRKQIDHAALAFIAPVDPND